MGKVIIDTEEYKEILFENSKLEEELKKCISILCELHKMENYEDMRRKLSVFLWENHYIE